VLADFRGPNLANALIPLYESPPTHSEVQASSHRTPYLGSVTLHFGGEAAFCQMESR